MRAALVVRLVVGIFGVILLLPVAGYAQEVVSGTVTDATGAVLPGATVTAVHDATGNTFVAVTNAAGAYRLAVRPGLFRVSAELAGFTTVLRTGVELLVGQQVVVGLEMKVSSLSETVTVSAEAPLLETTTSNVSGNVDPRQMQELPLQGRNWMDLTLLTPGSRSNAATAVPQDRQGFFQINVDGQQVTQLISSPQANQVRFSRDAIAEFELVTNRFDATQGRSQGMIVNAVTKSGTNAYSGTLAGYFRDDRFNAKDFIQDRVLPYSNQQISATFGGPIQRDRIHFFGSYEYEREPRTATFSSPYPAFNIDLPGTSRLQSGMGKVDVQMTPQSRFYVRYARYTQFNPNQSTGGASLHPSSGADNRRDSDQVWAVQTQVLGSRAVNELKGGFGRNHWSFTPYVTWNGSGPFGNPSVLGGGSVRIDFGGYSIGTASNHPQNIGQYMWALRDDFTISLDKAGRHDVKIGGEYFRWDAKHHGWCNRCNGVLRITAAPPANIQQLFPVWDDTSTWNLAALSPLVTDYQQSFGDHSIHDLRTILAGWVQDDWSITPRLTANIGLRYDLDIGVLGEKIELRPWLSGDRPSDTNNIAPRLGLAFQLDDRTVLRGGYGLFYTQLENDAAHQSNLWTTTAIPQVLNDGRADFAVNPFNGPKPTYEEVMANACDKANNRPGCFRRSITIEVPSPLHEVSFSHMASFGVQRQIGPVMAVEANYVFTGARKEEVNWNMNIAYNPATGANYAFTDRTRLPFPDWGVVLGEFMVGRSNYHGLETSFTKRYSDRWQAQASYTLSGFYSSPGDPLQVLPDGNGGVIARALDFDVAPDLGEDYTLAATDQRHRATFNGIWEMGLGFQLSGLYFFGSGERFFTNYGGDRRQMGTNVSWNPQRLRPDGTITPRAALVGRPIHRVDMRLRKRFELAGRASVEGLVEVFNLFNHENFGSYVTAESNPNYGRPQFSANVAYSPRSMQLGFRFGF